ncbi:MAG: sugar phosphate isomerase/epimerase [Dysgonamonadaceae bacterium]|jgi:sugar phosphate isomerase/epimerase|nr:sugar phosphate isomerase/epimerase [Dysgonamonadaceae bacterium]
MKVGFCIANCSGKPIEEVCRMVSEHGYESIEIPVYKDNGQIDADRLLLPGEALKFRKMLESHGLALSVLSNHPESLLVLGPYGVDTDSICPGTKEEKIAYGTKQLIQSAQLANALEVPVVVAFSGIENFGHINDWPYPGGWADEEKRFVENYLPIFDKFQEYGVKIAFEPHPNNIIYDTHTALRCLELSGRHPSYGINFDPANLLMAGINLQTFINELGSRIVAVHAKDCELVEHNMLKGGLMMQGEWGRLDRSLRFRIPGWGSIDWKKIITELYMVGFDGSYNYEHEDVTMSVGDGIEKTIAFLKPLMIKAPYEMRTDKLFQK